MLKKVIKYTDYDGNEREEDFYFNLSKNELIKMQVSEAGGFENLLVKIVNEKDMQKIIALLEMIILKSYGEKSLDGKRFIKSPELAAAFSQTEAYDSLFMELATNSESAAAFIKGIMPNGIDIDDDKAAELVKEKGLRLPENNVVETTDKVKKAKK